MELTESWKRVVPPVLQKHYRWVETRNATASFKASHPDEFNDMLRVLEDFRFDVERIVRSGGAKHFISSELDEAFRELGWREARYEQELVTHLVMQPYGRAGEHSPTVRKTKNAYGGHKIDNVKGRIGLDVEWNPKDGNLDRDLGNFRALYDGGAIDAGIILTRTVEGMRDLWQEVIAHARGLAIDPVDWSSNWDKRLGKTPADPLGTSTTSNFEKLVPRIERGDGGGCPILAIAITKECYIRPHDLDDAIRTVARETKAGREPQRLAQKMGLVP